MARSTGRLLSAAVLGVVGCAIYAQLTVFVTPLSYYPSSSNGPRSLVRLAASKQEIAEAEKHAKLLVWAAKTAAEQGAPQAASMQAKADQAVAALEALKQHGGSSPVSLPMASAPVASAPVAAAPAAVPAASSGPTKQEIAEAEKHAKLLVWAAKTAAEKGAPQAAMMKSKADQAVAALEALKQQQGGGSSAPLPVAAVAPAPVSSPPVAAAAAASAMPFSVPTKQELQQAKKEMDLLVWAAKTAAEKGAPQAATMKAKADAKVQAYEAMKAMMPHGQMAFR